MIFTGIFTKFCLRLNVDNAKKSIFLATFKNLIPSQNTKTKNFKAAQLTPKARNEKLINQGNYSRTRCDTFLTIN